MNLACHKFDIHLSVPFGAGLSSLWMSMHSGSPVGLFECWPSDLHLSCFSFSSAILFCYVFIVPIVCYGCCNIRWFEKMYFYVSLMHALH